MPAPGTKPSEGPKHHRGASTTDWTEVEDKPFKGKVPIDLPSMRFMWTKDGPVEIEVLDLTREWWAALVKMPHCSLWALTDWHYALATALVADLAFRGSTGAATELRQREKILGTTLDSRRDLRIRYVAKPAASRATGAKKSASVTALDERRSRLTSAS